MPAPREYKDDVRDILTPIRNEILGKTHDVGNAVWDLYVQKNKGTPDTDYLQENFSDALKELFLIERNDFWNKANIEIQQGALQAYCNLNVPEQEKLSFVYRDLNPIISLAKAGQENFDLKRLQDTYKAVQLFASKVASSMLQSGKARAGKCLEHHLEKLFSVLGYKYETQTPVFDGETCDFVFPSKEHAEQNPGASMICEAQTTLKDRFRLSTGKTLPSSSIQKYVFCAGGAGVVRNNDGLGDFSKAKLIELKSKGIILVVFNEVKSNLVEVDPSVISFDDFVIKNYPGISLRWE